MPTPVSSARQCLTDEAARALGDAVAVARRRSHAQTTSLHAVSALLALPSSTLREACARARSSAYSPRIQFRALELSVGVSLDRLPSSKSQEEPPVSNSLMAAIKRSQANQRRHPDSFHLHQIHSQQQAASLLKVELKHFMLSILDDPIVSRVFGEAGFRSSDIKMAILHPPVAVTQASSRFSRTRCPPIFLCNLTDSDAGKRSFSFPFTGVSDGDENCRRIGEIIARKSGRNPLLLGYCANDALKSFTENFQSNNVGVLPPEIAKLSLISIENEISEFVVEGGSKENMGLKFDELIHAAERCPGPGIVVNFGELKVLVGDGVASDASSYVVEQLTNLLKHSCGKVWLIGSAGPYEMYLTFVARFPTVEKDWDLHLLPITSSKPSIEGVFSKSSLMGSFVPFGGFFTSSSNFKNPLSSINQPFTRCQICTEKYEQDVAMMLKVGSTLSVADQYSESIPSWLQMAEYDTREGMDVTKARDDRTTLNAKILGLQKKWNDICQRLHHTASFTKVDMSQDRSQVSVAGKQYIKDRVEISSKDSSLNEIHSETPNPNMTMDLQKFFPSKQNIQKAVSSEAGNVNFQPKPLVDLSKGLQIQTGSPWYRPTLRNVSTPPDPSPHSSLSSVTTDLGLGTLYASTSQKPSSPLLQDHKERLQHFSGSISAEFDSVSENSSHRIAQSSSCSGSDCGGQFDPRDFKSLRRSLAEKVGWQDEAVSAISQAVSRCKAGNGRHRGSSLRGDIWLTFLGPDKVGKKKIAFALAEIMFGRRESVLSVDLSSHDRVGQSNSIFECEEQNGYDVKFRGKTVVDYVAAELSKKPYSVVFLENADKADVLAQSSLSRAIGTGKFPDSYGREISLKNMIFVTTAAIKKVNRTSLSSKEPVEFCEEKILGAKSWQMQILIGCVAGDASRSHGLNVRITPSKGYLNQSSVNKRKLIDISDSIEQENTLEMQKRLHKASRSNLDLNVPVEEMEEEINYGDSDSDANSENSETWLEEFFNQVDEKVVFKAFDFNELAHNIVKEINIQFQRIFGSGALLEIDHEVMVQILAAAWLTDRKRAIEDWVEKVLRRSFAEAQQKYCLATKSVVKLVACEGIPVKEQASGLCLPARINVN